MAVWKYITFSAGLFAAVTGLADASPVTVRNETVLRAGPRADSRAIGQIPAGTKMEMTACSGGYCQVDFNGIAGFVNAADFSTAGAVRSPLASSAENAHRSRNRVSHKSTPAGSPSGSAPSVATGDRVHTVTPSSVTPARP